jgi:hypothetical protein
VLDAAAEGAGAPPAEVGVLVTDFGLPDFVVAVPDLPATKGAAVEMLLICMIANL